MKLPKNWKEILSALIAGLATWKAFSFNVDIETLLAVATASGLVGGGHKTVAKKVAKRKASK